MASSLLTNIPWTEEINAMWDIMGSWCLCHSRGQRYWIGLQQNDSSQNSLEGMVIFFIITFIFCRDRDIKYITPISLTLWNKNHVNTFPERCKQIVVILKG